LGFKTTTSGDDMWQLWRWAGASNDRAVENARAATVECSRRLVERAEVDAFLADLARDRRVIGRAVVPGSQHPA
jgi:hypothetical protein